MCVCPKWTGSLAKDNIVLSWARLQEFLFTEMRQAGLVAELGESNFYDRITDGVETFVAQDKKIDKNFLFK